MARDPTKETESNSRLGNLWAFWPVFLCWGSVAAWLAAYRWSWFRTSAPDWLIDAFHWSVLGTVFVAAIGFVVVTLRSRTARHWFPVLLNLSTVVVAYSGVMVTVMAYQVRDVIARAEERQHQTELRIERLQKQVERLQNAR